MRICLFSREYPPGTGWGGIGAYTFAHAEALRQLGHDVEVISLEGKGYPSNVSGQTQSLVPVHRAKWEGLLQEISSLWIATPYLHYALKSALALWTEFLAAHERAPFDVIEAPEHLAEALFPALTRVCPLVIRLHTSHFKFVDERYHNLRAGFDEYVLGMIERIPIQECDLVSSPSQSLADYVAKDGGYDSSEFEIVRNPVDSSVFTPEGPVQKRTDTVTVLFVGRLEERKGVHHLVKAIPQVLKACSEKVRFAIVGADTNTDPGGRSVLEGLRKSLSSNGCLDAVDFLSHVPLAEMPDYYRGADICVLGSLYDNAPCTILEAMACGKPMIGSCVGGIPEYVTHNQTGLIVLPADPDALAKAIIDLVQSPEQRRSFGESARRRVEIEFDRISVARQAVSSYEKAICRYKDNSKKALYRRSTADSLTDFISLVCAYQENISQFLYTHSLRFRLKTWLQECRRSPRLFLAARCVELADAVFGKEHQSQRIEAMRTQELQRRESDRMRQVDWMTKQIAKSASDLRTLQPTK